MLIRLIGCALLVSVILGCGGREGATKVQPPAPPQMAKAALEEIAANGQLSSSVEVLQQQLEAMRETEPGKANELLADYDKLIAIPNTDGAAIKAKAKEMAGKL